MAYPTILIIAIALPFLSASGIGWLFSEDARNDPELELLKKIEIERMKAHIMQELGLTEIPVVTGTSKGLSDSMIQMLLAENEPAVKQQKHLARLLILPSNANDFQCKRYNSTSCRRFEYNISPRALHYTTVFWFYKLQSLTPQSQIISALCSRPGEVHEQVIERDNLVEEDNDKWVSFRLPMLKQLALWQGNLICAIEVTGMVLGEEAGNLPFLKMVQDLDAHSRSKRSEHTVPQNETCKLISFNVSFEDIGFGDYIAYPKIYKANLCRGYCLKAQTMHEILVDMTFQSNSSLEREHGRCWSTCCRPKTYDPLRLFHKEDSRNGTETYVDREIQSMVVTSCWCS